MNQFPNIRNAADYTPRNPPPAGSLYVGRSWKGYAASPWANMHNVGDDNWANRVTAVWKYTQQLLQSPQRKKISEIRDAKHLICWCSPHFCHAHALAWMVTQLRQYGTPCPACGHRERQSWLDGQPASNGDCMIVTEVTHCPQCSTEANHLRQITNRETTIAWAALIECGGLSGSFEPLIAA
jgi:hypothetical protein